MEALYIVDLVEVAALALAEVLMEALFALAVPCRQMEALALGAASHRRVVLVASVEEEEVDCIVAVAAAEEALMVSLYSYPEVACLEAFADSLEAFAVEEASAVEEAY